MGKSIPGIKKNLAKALGQKEYSSETGFGRKWNLSVEFLKEFNQLYVRRLTYHTFQ